MYWYKLKVANDNQMKLPVKHNKQFYHTAETLIIQVANVLYGIPSGSPFIVRSSVLKDMIQMTHSPMEEKEGGSDHMPIQFSKPFSVKKMDNLLGWFYRELGVFEKENEMVKEALEKVQFFMGTKWYQTL
ncbi:hypothetical protein M422DRAFT_250654 [Sphaerobolus stellatus SS14]|uniref:Uncharacterized protein n=1 Tax=Sphaerobolus stellatus (strain SS14) TaxID=990650 RepID=A0A0C9W3U2_SPHS4|nr:hypothetical protein M422DRAFT_250654 [Sphaerobolus stellatus SS14]